MASDTSNPSVQKTVLVVEDNDLNSKLLNDLLQYQGYTVVTTRFGEAALELARRYKPDAILMDTQLPDISGMEATRRIKADQETRTIPIIAVTAFAMPGDEANILASGCDAYVSKPFNVREFPLGPNSDAFARTRARTFRGVSGYARNLEQTRPSFQMSSQLIREISG